MDLLGNDFSDRQLTRRGCFFFFFASSQLTMRSQLRSRLGSQMPPASVSTFFDPARNRRSSRLG
jgi:hypothetical protein